MRCGLALLLCASAGTPYDAAGAHSRSRNVFAFHDTYKPGGKGYGHAWELYPWDRIQTVGVFGDHNPALVAKAAREGAKFAVNSDPGAVLDPDTSNATARSAWVKSAVAAAQAVNATAINIDHEATMVEDSPQSALLSAVMAELGAALREAIPGAELSFDAAARPCYEHRCYNYSAIAAAVDWIFVMDYDLNDYDDPPPDNDHSRANAPLATVEAGLKRLIAAGVPPEKIVCGLPWYGYAYLLTKKGIALDNAQVEYWRIERLLSNASWTSHWDEASQTPYLFDTAVKAGWREIWYDNPKSLRLKVAMAKQLGVQSFGMWTADKLNYSQPEADWMEWWDALS